MAFHSRRYSRRRGNGRYGNLPYVIGNHIPRVILNASDDDRLDFVPAIGERGVGSHQLLQPHFAPAERQRQAEPLIRVESGYAHFSRQFYHGIDANLIEHLDRGDVERRA